MLWSATYLYSILYYNHKVSQFVFLSNVIVLWALVIHYGKSKWTKWPLTSVKWNEDKTCLRIGPTVAPRLRGLEQSTLTASAMEWGKYIWLSTLHMACVSLHWLTESLSLKYCIFVIMLMVCTSKKRFLTKHSKNRLLKVKNPTLN